MSASSAPEKTPLSDLDAELDRLMTDRRPLGTCANLCEILGYSKPHMRQMLRNLDILPIDLGTGVAHRYRMRETLRRILSAPPASPDQSRARTRAATALRHATPEARESHARKVAEAAASVGKSRKSAATAAATHQ